MNDLINRGVIRLSGPNYYWFFAALMTVAATLFVLVALTYREAPQEHATA